MNYSDMLSEKLSRIHETAVWRHDSVARRITELEIHCICRDKCLLEEFWKMPEVVRRIMRKPQERICK